MKNQSGIYQIRNTETGAVYVGSALDIDGRWKRHKRTLNRGVHHSAKFQNAWNKYGVDKFEISVLEFVDSAYLIQREQFWLDQTDAAGKNGYNILRNAGSSLGLKHSPETLLKISRAHKGKTISAEARAAVSAAHKGKPISEKAKISRAASWTEERRRRRSEISRSIVLSDEAKAKISAAHKGREFNEEWRAKISAANKGRKPSDEARARMCEAHKNRKPISEETRAKMAAARIEYWKRRHEATE
jgi:group I intron endonuclease